MRMRGEPKTGHMACGGDRGKRPGHALEANELLPLRQHFFYIYISVRAWVGIVRRPGTQAARPETPRPGAVPDMAAHRGLNHEL